MSKTKILILDTQEESLTKFKNTIAFEHKSSCNFKYTTFESFQNGSMVDMFDMVVVWAPERSEGDIEMSEEFFKHYSIAPVTAWYTVIGEGWVKENYNDTIIVQAVGEDSKADFKNILTNI